MLLQASETDQEYSRGCSGAFTLRPGVFGSSMVSGSGGLALPSTLNWRERAILAAIVSRFGIFLYPTLVFFTVTVGVGSCVALSSFSSFSAVIRSSPGSKDSSVTDPGFDPVAEAVEPGEAGRVDDALTAMESLVATVDTEVVDPVRNRDAASRGRFAALTFVEADAPLLRFILAASWLREGKRPEPAGLGWGCS